MTDPLPISGQLLFTKGGAGEKLGVSRATVDRLIAAGALRPVHILGAVRIPEWEIERYARETWAAENGVVLEPKTTPAPAKLAPRAGVMSNTRQVRRGSS